MARTILIEVQVEEIDSVDPGYVFDPKTAYELTPVDRELDGSIEFVCRKSQIRGMLARLDKRGVSSGAGSNTRAIYGEPEDHVGTLMRDAAHKTFGGFNIPALDAIVDSIEEAVMPTRVKQRRKLEETEEGE